MRDRSAELASHRLDVLSVLSQSRKNVAAWVAAHPLPFPVLVDDDRSRAKRWGVYVALSFDSIRMARPASFVVDETGIVRYARISRHQLDDAPLDEIIVAAGRKRG